MKNTDEIREKMRSSESYCKTEKAMQDLLMENGGSMTCDELRKSFKLEEIQIANEVGQVNFRDEKNEKGQLIIELESYLLSAKDEIKIRKMVNKAAKKVLVFDARKTMFVESKVFHVSGFSIYLVFALYNSGLNCYQRATLDLTRDRLDLTVHSIKVD